MVTILEVLATLFAFLIGLGVRVIIGLYIADISQTAHAIRRNYPAIGRFRDLFEDMGTFFRQYFFAMDREELPFNRAQRSWLYRAAKNIDNTSAFGSTCDLRPTGTVSLLLSTARLFRDVAVGHREAPPGHGLVLALEPEAAPVFESKRGKPATVGTAGVQVNYTRGSYGWRSDHELRPVSEEYSQRFAGTVRDLEPRPRALFLRRGRSPFPQ